MRKFHVVYKEKQNRSNELFETKILSDFKNVYSTLLNKYSIVDFYNLNEEGQITFLAELNSFWDEEKGILEKGKKFLQIRSDVLSENSTTLQKKNFLKNKVSVIISESIRQSQVKWKIYDIINEMYNELQASTLVDILSPEIISNIIEESFQNSLNDFMNEINHELTTSAKEVDDEINENKKLKSKTKVRNRGNAKGSKKVNDNAG